MYLTEKVIAGTRGKKERTKSYNAFSSINFPYIAIIQEDHILFYLDDKAQVTEPLTFYHQMDSSVGLMKLIPLQTLPFWTIWQLIMMQ